MRPKDLLHLVKLDFSLIESGWHPYIHGVQVTAEEGQPLTADVQFKGPSGMWMVRFRRMSDRWFKIEE